MCRHDEGHEALMIALQACLVVDVLLNFKFDRKPHPHTEKAIKTIAEVREVLATWGLGEPRFSHHSPYRYRQMEMIHKVTNEMEPPITVEELDQWLANQDRVREFFSALQSWGTSICAHS